MTLALGIGINAALFSVVNGVLSNPLPFIAIAGLLILVAAFACYLRRSAPSGSIR